MPRGNLIHRRIRERILASRSAIDTHPGRTDMGHIVPVPPSKQVLTTTLMRRYQDMHRRPIASLLVDSTSPIPEPYSTRWLSLLTLSYSTSLLPSCSPCSWRNQMCHVNQGLMMKCNILKLTNQPHLQDPKRISLGLPPLEHRGTS